MRFTRATTSIAPPPARSSASTPEEVTSDQRRYIKAVNFGLIYGMSAFGLAQQLDIERGAAQQFIDKYFARYPGVAEYMQRTRELARQHGLRRDGVRTQALAARHQGRRAGRGVRAPSARRSTRRCRERRRT